MHQLSPRGRWVHSEAAHWLWRAVPCTQDCRPMALQRLLLVLLSHESNAFQWENNPPKLPLSLGDLRVHLTHGSLSSSLTACWSGQPFFCSSLENCLYFIMGWDMSPKIAPSPGGSRPPLNTCFLGPTWVYSPNSILITSGVFAGIMVVTSRHTDRPWYIGIKRLHLYTVCMRCSLKLLVGLHSFAQFELQLDKNHANS